MSTAMQRAFIMSSSVNTDTPLGTRILKRAAEQFKQEQEHIRFVAVRKAEQRLEHEAAETLKSFGIVDHAEKHHA